MWWNMRKYWYVRKALDDTGTKERDKLLDLCSECRKVVEFRGNLLEHGHPLKVKEGVNCQYAGHSYRINRLTLEGIPNHKKVWTGPFRNLITTAYSKHKAKVSDQKNGHFQAPSQRPLQRPIPKASPLSRAPAFLKRVLAIHPLAGARSPAMAPSELGGGTAGRVLAQVKSPSTLARRPLKPEWRWARSPDEIFDLRITPIQEKHLYWVYSLKFKNPRNPVASVLLLLIVLSFCQGRELFSTPREAPSGTEWAQEPTKHKNKTVQDTKFRQ